jgi:hypothetical protein
MKSFLQQAIEEKDEKAARRQMANHAFRGLARYHPLNNRLWREGFDMRDLRQARALLEAFAELEVRGALVDPFTVDIRRSRCPEVRLALRISTPNFLAIFCIPSVRPGALRAATMRFERIARPEHGQHAKHGLPLGVVVSMPFVLTRKICDSHIQNG